MQNNYWAVNWASTWQDIEPLSTSEIQNSSFFQGNGHFTRTLLKDEAQFFGSERREESPQMDTVQIQMDTNCLVPSIRIRFESFVVPTYPWFVDATIKLSQKDGLGRWGSSSIAMISPWTGNTCPAEKFRTRSKHLSWLAVYQICISPWLCFKQHSNKWMFRVMGNTCAKCHTVQPFPTFFSLRRISECRWPAKGVGTNKHRWRLSEQMKSTFCLRELFHEMFEWCHIATKRNLVRVTLQEHSKCISYSLHAVMDGCMDVWMYGSLPLHSRVLWLHVQWLPSVPPLRGHFQVQSADPASQGHICFKSL